MSTFSLPPKLAGALVIAQKAARGVEKDSRNDYHKYPYASAEAMIDEGRRALLTADLALFEVSRAFKSLDTRVEQGGGDGDKRKPPKGAIGRVKMRYALTHASGEAIEIKSSTWVVPESGRPEDKAESAAVTSDLGYTIRGLLLLPRGMDASPIDARDDRDYDGRDPEPDRRPPSDRPSDSGPRDSGPRPSSAGDRAAEAQTGVPQHRGQPGFDPAHVALAEQIESEARAIQGDPADLYERACAARLPITLARRALFAVLCAAARNAPSLETLYEWEIKAHDISAQSFKWEALGDALKDAFDGADERLRGKAA